MKAILIDDEPNSSRNLERKLMMVCPEVDVITSCTTVTEGVEAIQEYRPDLIFLDMELGAEEGFEVLDRTKDIPFETIVVTVHPTYAKDAFQYKVAHFLTKPVQKEHLREAVERIIENQSSDFEKQLAHLQTKLNQFHRIGVRLVDQAEILFLNIQHIIYCESSGSHTKVYVKDKRPYLVSGTLGNFTKALEQHHFIRIHNQYLINLLHLECYKRTSQNVIMQNADKPLSVSNSYKGQFIVRLREITIR